MQKLIFATGNEDKMKEIRAILSDMVIGGERVQILSMKEIGINLNIIEDGTTFTENAVIKAKAVAACEEAAGMIVLADDSGLEIDYINKEPGIYSARYMGEDTSYHKKNLNLISRLTGVEKAQRTARFVCSIAAVLPNGQVLTALAAIEGQIGHEEKGSNGFGYDPIFEVPSLGKAAAELTDEEKNAISHRGQALRAMKERLTL